MSSTHRPPFIAIAAVDLDGGLARAGTLPWHVPSDLKRFRRLTVGNGNNAIVMGRLTFASPEVGQRPLPKRRNLVMTRSPFDAPGITCVATWNDVMAATADCDAVWIAGGAQIYASAFAADMVDAVEITRIGARFGCDLFFPPVPSSFQLEISMTREDGGLVVTDERWSKD